MVRDRAQVPPAPVFPVSRPPSFASAARRHPRLGPSRDSRKLGSGGGEPGEGRAQGEAPPWAGSRRAPPRWSRRLPPDRPRGVPPAVLVHDHYRVAQLANDNLVDLHAGRNRQWTPAVPSQTAEPRSWSRHGDRSRVLHQGADISRWRLRNPKRKRHAQARHEKSRAYAFQFSLEILLSSSCGTVSACSIRCPQYFEYFGEARSCVPVWAIRTLSGDTAGNCLPGRFIPFPYSFFPLPHGAR